MLSFIHRGRMIDAVRQAVRSIPVVFRSPGQRFSTFESILNTLSDFKGDIQRLHNVVPDYDDNFAEFSRRNAINLEYMTRDLKKYSIEFIDISLDIQHHGYYFGIFKADIEEELTVLGNKTRGKLGRIEREIKKTSSFVLSGDGQHRGEDGKRISGCSRSLTGLTLVMCSLMVGWWDPGHQ
jgi:hypothetical protein